MSTNRLGRWLLSHPRLLERAYRSNLWLFQRVHPLIRRLGYGRVDRWLRPAEDLSKRIIFDCRMCGQCILHSCGMTCPMTCPKNLRNGPCGGVQANGNCEVIPDMKCVWVEAFERSQKMPTYGREMILLQPPLDNQLQGSSAWINTLTGKDKMAPVAWEQAPPTPVIRIDEIKAWKPLISQKAA